MTDKELIRSKIERYEVGAQDAYNPHDEDCDFFYGKVVACEDLKTIIDPLPAESKLRDKESWISRAKREKDCEDIILEEKINCLKEIRKVKERYESASLDDAIMVENILGTYKTLEDMLDLTTSQDRDILESMNFEREWLKQKFNTEFTSPELEEEIKRYQQEDCDRDTTIRDVARHFANWQKAQMEKEAVGAKIGSFQNGEIYNVDFNIDSNLQDEDKVKLIILKQ